MHSILISLMNVGGITPKQVFDSGVGQPLRRQAARLARIELAIKNRPPPVANPGGLLPPQPGLTPGPGLQIRYSAGRKRWRSLLLLLRLAGRVFSR